MRAVVGDSELLELTGTSPATAGYGRLAVLRDMNLLLGGRSVVALLGPNGAGKSTLLRVLAGTVSAAAGTVVLAGRDSTCEPAYRRTRSGLCLIPEGRGVFRALTVKDNLRLEVPKGADESAALDRVVSTFPVLGRRLAPERPGRPWRRARTGSSREDPAALWVVLPCPGCT